MSNETHNDAKEMSFADMVDGMLVFTTGPVIGATLCPGMTVCVPGLVLFGAAIAVPIVALAAAGLLLGAMTALPYLVVRTSVRVLRRRSRHRRATRCEAASSPDGADRRRTSKAGDVAGASAPR